MTGCYLGTGVLLGVDRARSGAQTAAADEIDRSGAGAPLPFAMTVEPARGCWRLPIQTALRNLAPLKFGENHRPMCGMRNSWSKNILFRSVELIVSRNEKTARGSKTRHGLFSYHR